MMPTREVFDPVHRDLDVPRVGAGTVPKTTPGVVLTKLKERLPESFYDRPSMATGSPLEIGGVPMT